jgi:hypothetical protein
MRRTAVQGNRAALSAFVFAALLVRAAPAPAIPPVPVQPQPALGLSTPALSFDSNAVGRVAPAQTVTVSNTGNATLDISSVLVTGGNASDFQIVSDTCSGARIVGTRGAGYPGYPGYPEYPGYPGYPGVVGETCQVSVVFRPGAAGGRAAVLRLFSNDPSSPAVVSLNGVGIGPPAPLPGIVRVAHQKVTLAASGKGSVRLTCRGQTACVGTLKLIHNSEVKIGGTVKFVGTTIATASFNLLPETFRRVNVQVSSAGLRLLPGTGAPAPILAQATEKLTTGSLTASRTITVRRTVRRSPKRRLQGS